ncbi:ribonuclease HI [Pseudoramibacter porci]|uniref:ribonuclease H n=1 Tax=Pseudoramibacter porci TaxID=2606631 RepID=A0A7X2NFZ5_9FIRM|nr:ribonuclease HI [Pseudoramibacter porci]MSS19907.1 ribonuclease HI [Pseudoramibacter porci]
MKKVKIYTDGGCRGNGQSKENVGGIGGILIYGDYQKTFKQGFKNTTNNKMELLAAITGLQMLKEPCEVALYSDSAYVVNAFNQHWVDGWAQKGWKRGKNSELKNADLWKTLYSLAKIHRVSFIKVKGHANDHYNNKADQLVNQAMDEVN